MGDDLDARAGEARGQCRGDGAGRRAGVEEEGSAEVGAEGVQGPVTDRGLGTAVVLEARP